MNNEKTKNLLVKITKMMKTKLVTEHDNDMVKMQNDID